MQRYNILRSGGLACALLALVSCAEGLSSGNSGFREQYFSARSSLEAGKYAEANRAYTRLLDRAGPFEPRIRLEYAHSLLRGGDYAAARREARTLTQDTSTPARRAALSVAATAEHQLGLAAVQSGDNATAKTLFQQADAAITEVLTDPGLDPLGALAGRQKSIRQALKAMG